MYPWISRTLDFWLKFFEKSALKKVRLIHGRLWYLFTCYQHMPCSSDELLKFLGPNKR